MRAAAAVRDGDVDAAGVHPTAGADADYDPAYDADPAAQAEAAEPGAGGGVGGVEAEAEAAAEAGGRSYLQLSDMSDASLLVWGRGVGG